VQFSGGRDSSLVLSIAERVARREGLPEPIAFTRVFPGIAEAEESSWQEQVIRFLGVSEWERFSVEDQLDLVGPVAGPSLVRHGLLWPPMLHLRVLDLERARGGAMLDGEGGDELFGPGRLAPVRAAVGGRLSPTPRNMAKVAVALSPRTLRRAAYRHLYRSKLELPWLRPVARRQLERAVAADHAAEPADWRRAVLRHLTMRGVALYLDNSAGLAAEADVLDRHPLLEAPVVAAVASAGRHIGFRNRTVAMQTLFGDLLPEAVLARTTKARFNRAVFQVHSRQFAAQWDGRGVDPELVDPEVLHRTWSDEEVNGLSFALLQACWLAARGDGV
jgi:asparagine synthase (glutamine-hydrolysing)